jgi:hypothetical protein
MNALFSALAVALTAFSVWLMVRLVNRRERWAKWTLVATIAIPVGYVGGFGPACWSSSQPLECMLDQHRRREALEPPLLLKLYTPIAQIASSESMAGCVLVQYLRLGIPDAHVVVVPTCDDDGFVLVNGNGFEPERWIERHRNPRTGPAVGQ